jgi:hypothetical protein
VFGTSGAELTRSLPNAAQASTSMIQASHVKGAVRHHRLTNDKRPTPIRTAVLVDEFTPRIFHSLWRKDEAEGQHYNYADQSNGRRKNEVCNLYVRLTGHSLPRKADVLFQPIGLQECSTASVLSLRHLDRKQRMRLRGGKRQGFKSMGDVKVTPRRSFHDDQNLTTSDRHK